jgi:translation initiation factor 1 (eIF-1/SUI1)
MGEVIQLQGDHRIKIRDFLVNEDSGLALDEKNIKVRAIDGSAANCQHSLTT